MIKFIKDFIHAYKVVYFQKKMNRKIIENKLLEELNDKLSMTTYIPHQITGDYANNSDIDIQSVEYGKMSNEEHWHKEYIQIIKEFDDIIDELHRKKK